MASEFNHGSGYNIGYGGTGTFYRKRLYWAHFYLGGQLYSEPSIWVPETKTPLRPPPFLSFTPFSPHQLLAQIHCSFMRASHPQVLGTKRGFCLGPGILGLICGRIHPDALQGEGSLDPQRGMTHGHKEEDEGSRQLRRRIRCSVQSLQNQSHLGSPKSYHITAWMAPPTSRVSNEPISDLLKPRGLAGPHTLPLCPLLHSTASFV